MEREQGEGAWLHAQARLTITELSEACGLPQASLEELIECGALARDEAGLYAARCVGTVRDAARLCADLELDSCALALLVRFLERIRTLEAEVRHLSAQLGAPR